ncbi:MAG TPA: Mur ligase family protein [Candidatus Paceibacterota bacterium]|nr:Mur ligase family protein [Candidatus Paceibacterota bacterium]
MEPLRASSRLIRSLFPFGDFLYILQREEYDGMRYLGWMPRFFFRRNFLKYERTVYTKRAKAVLAGADLLFALWLGLTYLVARQSLELSVLGIAAGMLLIPAWVLLAHGVSAPFFEIAKRRLWTKASAKVKGQTGMRIVAIAGSYGKTTTRAFIYEMVRHSYRTQVMEGNINTTTGVAAWLLKHLSASTELLIIETDAYAPGEIRDTMRITPPDVAVITNVGDQHMERFRTQTRLARTLREAFEGARAGATLITDAATARALEVTDATFAGRALRLVDASAGLLYQGEQVAVPASLSASNRANLAYALAVADTLKIPASFVRDSMGALALPDRRQQPTELYGYEAIDDSYNISLTTARAGLEAARAYAAERGKKLLVVAAGIPELGPADKDGNWALGELLRERADHAVVLETMFSNEIRRGIADESNYDRYADLPAFLEDAHAKFPPDEWVLLLQPPLPDIYY